jgi:ABC-type molybdenum transport system, ATPase component/photorepair protein PhrA
VIALDGVDVVRDGMALIEAVTWRVLPGEHWAVLGPNGAGKTTLLQVVAGYLFPTRGRVSVLGHEFGRVDLRGLRRSIGWVSPVLARRLHTHDSALDVVTSGRFASIGLFFEQPDGDDFSRARGLLDALGCAHLAERSFGVLSQGEQQRVLIARALMADLRILILDEPTAGLDLAAREDLLESLDVLTGADAGPTVLLVTHHPEEIIPAFNRTLLLRGGRIVAAGPTEEVVADGPVSLAMGIPVEIVYRQGRFWALPGVSLRD